MHREIYLKYLVYCKMRNLEAIIPAEDTRNANSQPAQGGTIFCQRYIFCVIQSILGHLKKKNKKIFKKVL